MHIESTPVTGREAVDGLPAHLAALSQFYRALNTRDLTLMAANWLPSEEAVMDNPVGGIMRGWDAIRPVYERVFAGGGNFWFEFYDYSIHQTADTFLAVGRERGEYRTPAGEVLPMAIRTSRFFRLVDGRWRQVHHHGSIDDPALLAAYQAAVRGAGR
jgi:ketosteroid isomerase-like protein